MPRPWGHDAAWGQSPVELDAQTQGQLIDEGFAITLTGHDAIQSAVDKALGRFQIRLSAAWLHGWALQSASPEERGALRKLMRQMGRDQGQYCLLSVTPAGRRDVQVDVAIRGIARDTGRPRKWVRKVMIADWLLHPDGSCRSRDVSARMARARKHVIALASSLSTTEAAAQLGISVVGFQRLVGSGVLSPIRTRAFRKARFLRTDLVDMKTLLALPGQAGDAQARIAMKDAANASGCSPDHAVRLLIRGCLPSAVLVDREAGLDGILVCEAEWNAALQESDLGLADAARAMGIEEEALRKLRYSGLFPMRQGLSSRGRGIHHLIAWASFQKFCETYLTLPLAAQRFGLSVPEVRRLVREAGLPRAPGAAGVPIYAAERLGSLIAWIRAADQVE